MEEENTPLYQPLGGKPPECIIPKQIDCHTFRNMLNHFHQSYDMAIQQARLAGDEMRVKYLSGINEGLRIAWAHHLELEKFGP